MTMAESSGHGEGARVFAGMFCVIPLAIGILILSAVWGAFDSDPAPQKLRVLMNGREVTLHPNPGMEEAVKREFKGRFISNPPDFSHEFFGGIPLFFKLFISLIAGGFVLFGIAGIVTASKGNPIRRPLGRGHSSGASEPVASEGGYTCHKCGATLTPGADVSPSGDVKCSYCNSWFNIHRSQG